MFLRQITRPACVLRHSQQVRNFASQAPSNSTRNKLLAGAVGIGVITLMYQIGIDRSAYEESNHGLKISGKDSKPTFTGGDQGFVPLKLQSVEEVNHNTKKLRFQLPEPDDVSGIHITSAIIAKYMGPDMEQPLIRPYTPVSDEDARGFVDLLIKRYAKGPMSSHICSMRPGDHLELKGPIPKYPWTTNKHQHVALVCGGTGITPMYQLIRAIFKNSEDKTNVSLIFANVKEEDILLKKEFDELENTHPRQFKVHYLLDEPPKNWSGGQKGRISKQFLKTVLPEPKEENIKVFVCGPPGMYKAISGMKKSPQDQGDLSGILKELGYSKDQVFKF